MIEDKFDVKKLSGSPDDATAEVQCKACQHDFSVQLHILKAINCRHELGVSLTIICPQCHAEAMTTENESQIVILEQHAVELQQKIDDVMAKLPKRFTARKIDWQTLSMEMECKMCGADFVAKLQEGVNSHFGPGKLTITCPLCGNADETTKEIALERLEAITALQQLSIITAQLAELKKGGDDGANKFRLEA